MLRFATKSKEKTIFFPMPEKAEHAVAIGPVILKLVWLGEI